MKSRTPDNEFTQRQKEVLAQFVKGHSNREMADSLFVSETCIKNHMTKIFKKLGAKSRSDAIIKVALNKHIMAMLPKSDKPLLERTLAVPVPECLPAHNNLPIGKVRNG